MSSDHYAYLDCLTPLPVSDRDCVDIGVHTNFSNKRQFRNSRFSDKEKHNMEQRNELAIPAIGDRVMYALPNDANAPFTPEARPVSDSR